MADVQSAAKPAFDPNAPYETASAATPDSAAPDSTAKPAFDPNASYQTTPATPQASISATPKSSDIPWTGESWMTPEQKLSVPLVKVLLPVLDVLEKAQTTTPVGRHEHPVMSRIGDLANHIEELLTGGQSGPAGKPMGTKYGIVNNPLTSVIAAAPGAAEAVPAAASDVADAASSLRRVNPFRKVQVADEAFSTRPFISTASNEAAGTQAVKNIASQATEAAGKTATAPGSLREVWQEPIAARQSVAKGYYKQLDAASNNEWTANENALNNVRKEIRMKGGLSDDMDQALNARKTRLEWQQEQILDKVPAGTSEAAKSNWTQKSRLEDLQDIFNKKSNVTGVHPDLVTPELQGKLPPEKYNFKGIAKDLNTMDPADLTQALGGNKAAAQQLIGAVNLAAKEGWATAKATAAVRIALRAAGYGVLGHVI